MFDYGCTQLFESRIYPAPPSSLGIHPQAEGRDRTPLFSGDSGQIYVNAVTTTVDRHHVALRQYPWGVHILSIVPVPTRP